MNSKVIMDSYRNAGRKSSSLEMLGVLYNIHQKETKANVRNSFFSDMNDFSDIYIKYLSVRFLIRRMELGMEEEAYQALEDAIRNEFISYEAIEELILRTVIDKSKVLEKIKRIYEMTGLHRQYEACKYLLQMIKGKPLPITYSQKL